MLVDWVAIVDKADASIDDGNDDFNVLKKAIREIIKSRTARGAGSRWERAPAPAIYCSSRVSAMFLLPYTSLGGSKAHKSKKSHAELSLSAAA